MDAKVNELIAGTVRDLLAEQGKPVPADLGPDFPLYGGAGGMDSMALVTLVAELEMRLQDQLGKSVVLADERAMSRHRSPFRTLGALGDYVQSLLDEAKA